MTGTDADVPPPPPQTDYSLDELRVQVEAFTKAYLDKQQADSGILVGLLCVVCFVIGLGLGLTGGLWFR